MTIQRKKKKNLQTALARTLTSRTVRNMIVTVIGKASSDLTTATSWLDDHLTAPRSLGSEWGMSRQFNLDNESERDREGRERIVSNCCLDSVHERQDHADDENQSRTERKEK